MGVLGFLTWLRDCGSQLAARWYIEALRNIAFIIEHGQWLCSFDVDVEAIRVQMGPKASTNISRALKSKIADLAAAGDKGMCSGASVAHWRKQAAPPLQFQEGPGLA